MNKHITYKLMSLLSRRELKERLGKVALVMSCFAVFCITYILVAPVLTEEWPVVCGMEEHTHDESCYTEQLVEPAPELICGMEETGHVHTDACYEMHQGDLMCTETGTEEAPHEHDESCYAWSYELTCTESTEGHIHDESCYAEPAEPYTELVLTCELPEHTHSDLCFDMSEADNGPEFACGFLTEHIHTEECYFEDGSLKCTVPEHTHTKNCVVVELPKLGENEELMPVDEQFTYENEEVAVTFTVQGEIPVAVMETEENKAAEAETEPVETTEPALELVVTESEDQETYDEYEELAAADGDVMLMQVLDYSLTLDGAPVDLSRCEVITQVTPKPELQQMMDSSMPLMTYAADDTEDESGETEMVMELTTYSESNGEMAYALVAEEDPFFTVQYYAWLDRAVIGEYSNTMTDSAGEIELGKQRKMPIINTDGGSTADNSNLGGKLPKNGSGRYNTPNGKNLSTLELQSDGFVKTASMLTEIYKSESLTYKQAPGLMYFNIVNNNAKSQYTLKEIWILQDQTKADGTDETGWRIVPYRSDIRFTNRPQTAAANPDDYILIEKNAVIRLVYDTKKTEEDMPANFYDYDITDGYIYANVYRAFNQLRDDKNYCFDTSTQAQRGKVFTNTKHSGINSTDNYTGKGTKLAFGNSNAGTEYGEVKWGAEQLNKANTNSFMIATYGLVQGLDANGHIIYSNGVDAPKLFNEESETGKTSYDKDEYSLKFDRVGDTYTLKAVNGTSATSLNKFNTIEVTASWIPGGFKYIHTNNFWPMDSAPSWGADGHDLKFGATSNAANRQFVKDSSNSGNLPTSDDDKDHNSYFGMQYAVTFDLSSSYVGPLEYFFFGDDDMWVFLDNKLVCDIGGVHTSVGQYVNLWDYIDRSELLNADGSPKKEPMKDTDGNVILKTDRNGNYIQQTDENGNLIFDAEGKPVYEPKMTDVVKTYKLTFFYTERGASGSTCWMQFTLPTVVGVDLASVLDEQLDDSTGSISIEKRLDGIENNEWFEFSIDKLDDNYKPLLYNANGELITDEKLIEESGYIIGGEDARFKIRAGDVLVLRNLPESELTVTEIGQTHENGSSLDGYQSTVTVNGEAQNTAPHAAVTIVAGERTKVVYTNISSYELPATGGSGTVLWYTIGGMLVLTGLFLLVYKNKQKRGKATI